MIIKWEFSTVLHKNIYSGNSLELPRQGDSNELYICCGYSLESPSNEFVYRKNSNKRPFSNKRRPPPLPPNLDLKNGLFFWQILEKYQPLILVEKDNIMKLSFWL